MLPRLALGRNLRREEGTHGGECEGAHCSSAGAGVYRSPLKTGGGTLAAAVPGPHNRPPPVSRTFCCQGATPSIKYTDALRVDMCLLRGAMQYRGKCTISIGFHAGQNQNQIYSQNTAGFI
jgi:hypothetical protein